MTETLDKALKKLLGSDVVEKLLEDSSSDKEIDITVEDLPEGAAAQTLPTGKVMINEDVEDDDKIDTFEASRIVHELSHTLNDQNYLDKPEEREAFQKQIDYLLEQGVPKDKVKEYITSIFDDYKSSHNAESLSSDMIEESKYASLQKLVRIAQLQELTFTPEEKAIIDKVEKAASDLGITVYLAGGLIRDRLLGKDNEDLDFVTDKGSERLAQALTRKYNLPEPIKMDRSGATMIDMGGKNIDIIDAERVFSPVKSAYKPLEEGQEAEMSIFLDDAFRRDLTINSLMYNIHTGELLDPTGKGLSDLENNIIRTIISPNIKYRIHAPDMLRALRFYSQGDWKFAPGMLEAMKKNADKVKPRDQGGDISARRIERELRKAIKSPEMWNKMKAALAEVGLDQYVQEQIEDVDQDFSGDIEYNFDKTASHEEGEPDVDTLIRLWEQEEKEKEKEQEEVKTDEEIWKELSSEDDWWSWTEKEDPLDPFRHLEEDEQEQKIATAQEDPQVQGPTVQVDPSIQKEVQQAVSSLTQMDPNFFKGVSKIVALTGGSFGQVESTDPTVIQINVDGIKQEVKNKLGTDFNPSDPEHQKVFDDALQRSIVETVAHERAHAEDYDPETGDFPGGEQVAEQAEQEALRRLDLDQETYELPTTGSLAFVTKQAEEKEVATVALTSEDGDLLMAPRSDTGKWTLPGGHLEDDEEPEEGAIRELEEETSIEIEEDDLEHLGTETVETPSGEEDVTVHSFVAISEEEADPSDDPDSEVKQWLRVPVDQDGLPEEIEDNLHNEDKDVTLQLLGLQPKQATDYAGRPIPNTDALPTYTGYPYPGAEHGDYSGERILLRQYYEHQEEEEEDGEEQEDESNKDGDKIDRKEK